MVADIRLKKNARTGFFCVLVPSGSVGAGPRGKRNKWLSTGQTSLVKARIVIKESGVDRLALMARAGALTSDAISIITVGKKFAAADVFAEWQKDLLLYASQQTVATYSQHITAFLAHCHGERRPIGDISKASMDSFVNDTESKASTRYTKLASLRSLWKFAAANGYVIGRLTDMIRVRAQAMNFEQQETERVEPITEDEYQMILASDLFSPAWKRATVMGYRLALRIGDVFRATAEQIGDHSFVCWTHKRSKRVELMFDDPLIGCDDVLGVLRELKAEHPTGLLFPEQCAKINSPQRSLLSVQYIRMTERAGVPWRSFHSLRASAISRWRAAGKSLDEIGNLVAHSTEKQTQNYVHELTQK